ILKENIEYTLTEAGKVSGVLALRQIANRTLHPLERLFWLLLILAAIYGVNLLTKTQIHRYAESPTVISLDRDYLDWSGPLPAVTLCYNDHLDVPKANDFIFENWNVSISDDEYFYFLEFLISIINATVTNYGDIVRFAEDERFDDFDLYDVILEVASILNKTLSALILIFKLKDP
uniref:Ion transport domain-containing protein n=1 Tax=Megaselia scalaris TaxID=36166 RepID=T1GCI2_MEGSC